MKKKTVKEVKMQKLLVCSCKSHDFAQSQKKFTLSHDRETVTFRNSEYSALEQVLGKATPPLVLSREHLSALPRPCMQLLLTLVFLYIALFFTALFCAAFNWIVSMYFTVLHCTILVLYCTLQYCTRLH